MKTLLNLVWDRNAGADYLIYNLFKNRIRHMYSKTDIKVTSKS